MKIYVKAGDREPITKPNYEYTLRDGHIIQFRPDEEEIGKAIGYSTIIIRIPIDFWEVRGTRDWKSTIQKVYDLKKYSYEGAYEGKYPWDPGYINPRDISTPTNKIRTRRCDWFVDFKWMLEQGWITGEVYKSIYNFDEKTPPINLEYDFTTFIFHEDQRTRLVVGIKNMAWTSGDKTVGSAGADYTTWKEAVDDMGTLTGDANIIGLTAEEITETGVISIDNDLAGHLLTLKVTSGQKHNGGAYGTGHRINWGTYDWFKVDEVNAGEIDNVIIQDLAFDATGTGNYAAAVIDGGDAGHIIIQRCVGKGDSVSENGLQINSAGNNVIVRNNSLYGFSKASRYGINLYDEYGGTSWDIFNNTVCKCFRNIGDNSTSPAGTNITVRNNIAYGSTEPNDYYDPNSGFDTTAKNVSGDATSPDGATYQNWAGTANMEDYANNDFRLASTDATLDDGDDLSAIGAPEQFSDDIEDQTRSTWYIGASEIISAGDVTVTPGVINLVSSAQGETVNYGATISPNVISLGVTPQAETVRFGVTISPSAINLPVQAQGESVVEGTGIVVSPNVIVLTGVIPGETVNYGVTVSPSAQNLLAQLEAESVKCGVTVTPAAISLVAAAQDETVLISGGVTITPNAIIITTDMPLPTIYAMGGKAYIFMDMRHILKIIRR